MAKKSASSQKSPLLAAVLNFFVPGAGYIYAGKKRQFFSYGLALFSVLSYFDYYFNPYSLSRAGWLFGLLTLLLFAYDAYLDAME